MLTEGYLRNIIRESIKKVINENEYVEASLPQSQMGGQNVIEKIKMMIDQANQAYNENVQEYGDSDALMDKEAHYYGLNGNIRLLMNGFIVFPFNGNSFSDHTAEKIKVFTKVGGRYKLYKDEYHMDYDWRDAQKILKSVVADAIRYKKDMEGYNLEWEDRDNMNPQAVRDFNKSIGVKADARNPKNF